MSMTDNNITADQVAAFLRHQPDFFERRSDLLELLRLPDNRGNTVSLLERQALVLRDRNNELRERLNSLLDVARENDALFEKTRNLVLKLLEARTLPQFCNALTKGLQQQFGSDAVSLIIYDKDAALEGALREEVRCMAASNLHEALQLLLRQGKAVCGALRDDEVRELFPHHKQPILSAAMVPLEYQGRVGVLAIGSHDSQHFRSSLGTLFISYIGDVVARLLTDFVRDLPKLEARRA